MAKKKTKARRLTGVKTDEVSFVDDPANLRPFMFFKSQDGSTVELDKAKKPNIKVKSDGTIKGTSFTINGAEIANVVEMNLSFFKTPDMDDDSRISMSYTTANKTASGGFVALKRFTLAKALGTTEKGKTPSGTNGPKKAFKKATDEQIKTIRKFVGSEASLETVDENTGAALAESLGVLADYRKMLPPEVDEQLKNLVAAATVGLQKGEGEMAEKEEVKEELTEEEKKAQEEKAKKEAQKAEKEAKEAKEKEEDEAAQRIADKAREKFAADLLGDEDDGTIKPLAEGEEPTREATNALIESNNKLKQQVAALEASKEPKKDGKDGEETPAGGDAEDEEVELSSEQLAEMQYDADQEALKEVSGQQ